MRQSRKMSLIESTTNVAVGYRLAVLVQIGMFPLFGMSVRFGDNLIIGGVFTVVSLARSYTLRRAFDRLTIGREEGTSS